MNKLICCILFLLLILGPIEASAEGPNRNPASSASEAASDSGASGAFVLLAGMIFVAGRSFRANRKYKRKYLKPHTRSRRKFTRDYNEENEYNNEKIYRNGYNDPD